MLSRKGQSTLLLVALVLIIIGGIYYFYNSSTYSEKSSTSTDSISADKGRAVFAITDAAADMGSVSEIRLTVKEVQAHSNTESWTTVSSQSKTYDLLKLKADGHLELISDTDLSIGAYNQIRFVVDKVIVVDSEGEHEAKLPSNELKINLDFEVKENSTSTIVLDFIADESLHTTGNDKYILAPVIQVETRENAEVDVKSNNKVEISSGNIKTKVKVGMDIDGNVGLGLKISKDTKLNLDAKGLVSIG